MLLEARLQAASEPAHNAALNGWAVGSTPRVGSVAVFAPGLDGAGSVGHVAWVQEVYPNTGKILISEMNFKGLGIVDSRLISWAGVQFIYVNP